MAREIDCVWSLAMTASMMSALILGEKSLFFDSGISPVLKGSSVGISASVLQDSLVFHYNYNQLYLLLAMTHAPFHPKSGQCEGGSYLH